MDISEKTLVLKFLSDENYFWEIKRKKVISPTDLDFSFSVEIIFEEFVFL